MMNLLLKIKYLSCLVALCLCSFASFAQHIDDSPQRLDSLLRVHRNMRFYQSPTLGRSDSVWHRVENLYLYFDTDSIARQFVRKGGYNAIPDEMDYLYYAAMTEMLPEQKAREIEKIEKIARQYSSKALMDEVELLKTGLLPDQTGEEYNNKLASLKGLLQKAQSENDLFIQIRVMERIFSMLRYAERPFEALEVAVQITKILDGISDEQYVARRHLYFLIGETFYQYGYYEEAIPLLKKAVKDARYFFQRSDLQALNTLGLYYRNQNDLDTSDYYFRSMLESADEVKYRGEYDAIAMCNLSKNCLLRKNYTKAEMLLKKVLPVMKVFDATFTGGVYISLGQCYLATRRLPELKTAIDSARKCIAVFPTSGQYAELYPLMSKYYAATGNAAAAVAYTDSTVKYNKLYQDQYNASHIFHVEKKLYETEKQTAREELEREYLQNEVYRRTVLALSVFAGVVLALSALLLYNYRKKREAHRALVERIQQWAKAAYDRTPLYLSPPIEEPEVTDTDYETITESDEQPVDENDRESDVADQALFQQLERLMHDEHLYRQSDLTLEKVASRMKVSRVFLSQAVNRCTGRHFNNYLNEFRVRETVRIMSNSADNLTLEGIALESGFNSRTTLYRAFKKVTGLSPSEFLNNRQKNKIPEI